LIPETDFGGAGPGGMGNRALRMLLRQAGESCHERRCAEAIDLTEAALRLEPANASLHERLGLCYSGGCCAHEYASPEVAGCYLRHGLELASAETQAGLRARILDTLGNTYTRLRRFTPAIECHREASALYLAAGARDDWAREQLNLANTWAETGGWVEAVQCYHRVLEVRTRERDPRRWASVMENLGWAYREVHEYHRAIDCYRRALRVYTAAAFPRQKAALHNNLGHVYLCMPGARQARRALRHLDRALAVRTRTSSPLDYAATQFNRGHALARLGMPDAAACFGEARQAFTEAGHAEYAELARSLGERAAAGAGPLATAPLRDIGGSLARRRRGGPGESEPPTCVSS
jgi:tetratricopeptide (TPR) repeat protein